MAKPTSAAVILFLASSVLVLSPPEVIQAIPPQTKKAKTKTPAKMIAKETPDDKSLPMSTILAWSGFGTPMLLAAKATGIIDNAEESLFFIYLYSSNVLSCLSIASFLKDYLYKERLGLLQRSR